MILTSKILDKLLNSDYLKKIYPMIDNIDTIVTWDGDEEYPMYDIDLTIFVNDPEMTYKNMYEKGLDPHYLIDEYMIYLLKYVNVDRIDVKQVYVSVFGPDGQGIYGNY
jgi:hypothetical protein